MRKAVLISIQPEWVEKILNGEKTIEIRKSVPKCDLPIDVYIYVTKSKPFLMVGKNNNKSYLDDGGVESVYSPNHNYIGNGKVVAKFTLNKVEKFKVEHLPLLQEMGYVNPYTLISFTGNLKTMYLEQNSCLLLEDVYKYAQNENVFAWHIENLQIFDKPMELNQFEKYYDEPDDLKPCCNGKHCIHESYDWCENQICCEIDYDGTDCPYLKVNKAPQSWQYVYVVD